MTLIPLVARVGIGPHHSAMTAVAEPTPPISLRQFFERVPPLEVREIGIIPKTLNSGRRCMVLPAIRLHCPTDGCGGPREFDPPISEFELPWVDANVTRKGIAEFICRNCHKTLKTFAIAYTTKADSPAVILICKIGEQPRFGKPRPNAVADVLDDEIEYFDRGYRSETDGLGIGAFAYYRRFVESHKDKIIGEIRKVAVAHSLSQSIIDALDRAAARHEFSAAVSEVKDAIPDSIKINGMNPLTLLHDALSAGLHNDDDVECLAIAHDIRLVLTGLADRTSQLLKSNAELAAAVTRLNQRKAGQKPKG